MLPSLIVFVGFLNGLCNACGSSAVGLGGLVYFIPLVPLLVPFLPVILVVWGGIKAANKIEEHHKRPDVVRRREEMRFKRQASMQKIVDPQVVRKRLNGLLLSPGESGLEHIAACWTLLGRPHQALCALNADESGLNAGNREFHALVRSRVGDYAGVLQALLKNCPIDRDSGAWIVEVGCSNQECPACLLGPSLERVLDGNHCVRRKCTHCSLPLKTQLYDTYHGMGTLAIMAQELYQESEVSKNSAGAAVAYLLYDCALSITEVAAKSIMWRSAMQNILWTALVLYSSDKAAASDRYLIGCILYSLGALALPGERTRAALQVDPERRSFIEEARRALVYDNDGSATKEASRSMIQQCDLLLSTTTPFKNAGEEAALFEPWESLFNIEVRPEDHQFSPKFFSKFTFCGTCGNFVQSPLPNNGSECGLCGLQKHPTCEELIMPCVQQVSFTPEDRRRYFNWQRRKGLFLVWKKVAPSLPKDVVKKIFFYNA